MFGSHSLKKEKSKCERKSQMCSVSQNRLYYTFAAKPKDGSVNQHPPPQTDISHKTYASIPMKVAGSRWAAAGDGQPHAPQGLSPPTLPLLTYSLLPTETLFPF